jgi:hypothetical protein
LWSKLEQPIQQEWKTISDLVRSDKFQNVMADLKQIGEPAIDNLLDVVAKPEFQDLFPPELKSSMVYIIIILIILSLNDTVLNLPNVDTFAWCYLLCPACDFVHTGNSEVSLRRRFHCVYIFDVLTYTCQIFSRQVNSPKYF